MDLMHSVGDGIIHGTNAVIKEAAIRPGSSEKAEKSTHDLSLTLFEVSF